MKGKPWGKIFVAGLGILLSAGFGVVWAQSEPVSPQEGQQAPSEGQQQAASEGQNTGSAGQRQAAPRPPWLFLGPRMGVGGEIAQPSDFNDTIQGLFPSGNSYFPVYSQLGINLAERVALAESGYNLSFSELFTVSGLDQNFAFPMLSLLLGLVTPFGLEASLGPQLELANNGSGAFLAPSMVYAIGWRLSFHGISVPVTVFVNPLPPDRRVRLAVLAGVDYGFSPPGPTPRPPFNY